MKTVHSIVLGLAVAVMGSLSAQASVKVGDRPNIAWQTTDNKPITSQTLSGRIVVVDFWATWCGPCMAELPHMLKLHRELSDKGVVFVGISLDSSRADLDRVVKGHSIPWPQVADFKGWNNAVAKAWGVNSIPRMFILTPTGEVFWTGHPAKIDAPLAEALKQHPPVLENEEAKQQRELALTAAEAAGKYIDEANFAAALGAISDIDPATLHHAAVRTRITTLLRKVQVQAASESAWAEALESNPEHAAKLTALSEAMSMAVKRAAAPAASSEGPHPQVVAARLAQADKAHEAGDYFSAWTGYDWLHRLAPQSPEGETAAARLAEYEADPTISRVVRVERAERDAKAALAMARGYEKAGRNDLARAHYQKILDEHPDAERSCAEARQALKKLSS